MNFKFYKNDKKLTAEKARELTKQSRENMNNDLKNTFEKSKYIVFDEIMSDVKILANKGKYEILYNTNEFYKKISNQKDIKDIADKYNITCKSNNIFITTVYNYVKNELINRGFKIEYDDYGWIYKIKW